MSLELKLNNRKARFYLLSFTKHDFKASITVFFVALPLCLGVSLASGVPVYAGILAGIIGGIVVSLISKSELSVSGPAAGLTATRAAAITELGAIEIFFLSVAVAGLLQALIGILRLGGFTHFIPSAVIKGMLTAIGIILISKQVPLLVGYNQPDFWRNELFNILTFKNGFKDIGNIYYHTSTGAVTISIITFLILITWKRYLSAKIAFIPTSFITVFSGIMLAIGFNYFFPGYSIDKSQFVTIPHDVITQIKIADFSQLFSDAAIWRNALVICFVASWKPY